MDDLYTSGEDELLLGLAAFANVEIRLFNPFPGGREHLLTRFIASAHDFTRVNRRMHNKLPGRRRRDGRDRGPQHRPTSTSCAMPRPILSTWTRFVTGALVPKLQALFDDYWNDPVVFPLHAIVAPPDDLADLADLRAQFGQCHRRGRRAAARSPRQPDVLGYGPLSDELDAGRLGLVWASATAYADPPSRLKGMGASYGLVPLEEVESVRYNVLDLIRGARSEVVITSPYLIPGERGMAIFAEQRARGIKFKVLTNSLAATDEPLVHVGYRSTGARCSRSASTSTSSARCGCSAPAGWACSRPPRAGLHAKTAVVDRRRIFIGSMNFDPRSEKTNTEMGIFIDSPQLAREVLRLMDLDKLQASYRLMLGPDGQGLRWTAADDEGEISLSDEPDASFATKFWLELLAPLAPEELL